MRAQYHPASLCLLLLIGRQSAKAFSIRHAVSTFPSSTTRLHSQTTGSDDQNDFYFASTTATSATAVATKEPVPASTPTSQQQQRRPLGSQELLMLPRQYKENSNFPPMHHVVAVQLEHNANNNNNTSVFHTPSLWQQALQQLAHTHPLLQAHVQGSGEPDRRIDLFQMVRQGDPDPPTFVVDTTTTKAPTLIVHNNDDDWSTVFARRLDTGWSSSTDDDTTTTPLLWHVDIFPQSNVLLITFNHAISDQTSANRLLDELLATVAALESGDTPPLPATTTKALPLSLEECVLGRKRAFRDVQAQDVSLGTLQYVAGKAAEGFKNPVLLPQSSSSSSSLLGSASILTGRTAGGEDTATRRSTVAFRSLSPAQTQRLLQACRSRQVSMSNALTAAVTYTATDFVGDNDDRYYKVLQSLDMRRFGCDEERDASDPDTVVCMAGSHDLMHGPFPKETGRALRQNPTVSRQDNFWQLAREGKQQTEAFIASKGPEQAVRVFDFAMTIADLNNLVHLTAQSKDTKGRAYSAGVTNVGVYERQTTFDDDDQLLQLEHGPYKIRSIHFATPHVTSGCLYQVSAMTVGGSLQLTFNPVEPIVSQESNQAFADAFVDLLDKVCGEPVPEQEAGPLQSISPSVLPKVSLWLGLAAVATHAGAWGNFFQSVLEMKANVADPADFWAALNFWIFFAVGHPILQPILWISDVLHGSPGPMVAGLVPVTFLLGNAVVLGLLALSKEVRMMVGFFCRLVIKTHLLLLHRCETRST